MLDANPADLTAEVREGKRVLATADTTATVEVAAKPKKHTLKVVPTAVEPGDYFLAKKKVVEVDPAATKKVSVTLPYNRSNLRFTERTWEVKGISVDRANDVQSATMFGRRVNGGVNRACEPKVTAANTWFTTNVSAADQAAAQASIVSLVGQVKRTQSRGTFSNHSTGTAIDINPSESSLQNWHVKKGERQHATAMRVFSTIVAKSGVPALKDFDVWTERDRDRLLQASERFNTRVPRGAGATGAGRRAGTDPRPDG